ncbi:ABC transporter ATP-binding protein [candidate division WWE3 bacterium]|uniref:ABC transporter ATP-binding protein n=1 Tax=candidate division WWE3 bacterium TaxID=2053526 RepID=A0A955LJJ4_UNCKA|nr:ABC transporter ATP-binding protein [candidate division WWE3 bacterium]
MSIISLKNISKVYSSKYLSVTALHEINIELDKGSMIAIMGPSGSGKSTLMNVIGLLDRPSSGEIIIDGENVNLDMPDRKIASLRSDRIGFVFQSFNLLPKLSAMENVLMPLQYANNKPKNPTGVARELLGKVGLSERERHIPNQLSGGEKQRVAIARALINNPSIILADEPTGNLDTKSGGDVMNILKELQAEGKTVIIVTHDQKIADQCEKTIELLDGHVKS